MRRRLRARGWTRAAACGAAALCVAAAAKGGVLPGMLARTAAVSAALLAPDAAAEALRERFADIAQPQPVLQGPNRSATRKPVSTESEKTEEAPALSSDETDEPTAPDIPEEYCGTVLEEDFAGTEGGPYYQSGRAWLRNYTSRTTDDLDEILETPTPIKGDTSGEIQVLIYHTHATESYCPYDAGVYDTRYNWRTTDVTNNMVAVGEVITEQLRARGIGVLHDTELHDYPSYDGSYASSFQSVSDYLEEYPSIRVVLDVHRDAIERADDLIVKPVTEIDGQKYAQVMVISNCDDGSGLIPNWRENLRFAVALTDSIEQLAPGLTRPILFSYRKYNQQLSNGALLLEFGSHANTLEEAKRTAAVVGQALADVLLREE